MLRTAPKALIAIAVTCSLAAVAGCGNSRTPVPNISTPAPPTGLRTLSFPSDGLSLQAPNNWTVTAGHGSLITVVSSGAAVVALWRYPSTTAPPHGASALRAMERKLMREVRTRDPELQVISSTITRIGGVPAVELDALEQIAGQARRVSSSHLFEARHEVVLDEYAPPGLFDGVERAVFSPIRDSLLVAKTSGQASR